jgi:hypothetical protein
MLREKLKETINRKKYVRNYNKKNILYSFNIYEHIFL